MMPMKRPPEPGFDEYRQSGETMCAMLTRLDLEMRDRAALADRLGVSRRTLYRLFVRYEIREYRRA